MGLACRVLTPVLSVAEVVRKVYRNAGDKLVLAACRAIVWFDHYASPTSPLWSPKRTPTIDTSLMERGRLYTSRELPGYPDFRAEHRAWLTCVLLPTIEAAALKIGYRVTPIGVVFRSFDDIPDTYGEPPTPVTPDDIEMVYERT